MKRLFLLRHAKSDWGDPALVDIDRPLNDRGRLFPEDIDAGDPWQFKNFRVN